MLFGPSCYSNLVSRSKILLSSFIEIGFTAINTQDAKATRNNALDYSRRRNTACDSLRDRLFFSHSLQHRRSLSSRKRASLRPLCIPFRFVSLESIKFLYGDTHGRDSVIINWGIDR